jgi:hypothetical protein
MLKNFVLTYGAEASIDRKNEHRVYDNNNKKLYQGSQPMMLL